MSTETPNPINVRFGTNVWNTREKIEPYLSRAELAKAVGASYNTIRQLEQSGAHDIKLATAYAIAQQLGTTLDALLAPKKR